MMQNCYVSAKFNINFDIDPYSNMFGRNNPSLLNCYYIDNESLNIPAGQTAITDEEIANGKLCFLLNNNVSGATTWTQTIGTDEYPVPFSTRDAVYASGEVRCDGHISESTTFSNTEGEITKSDHKYNEEGTCEFCGRRYITTAEQLVALASDVESGYASLPVDVELGADIDMTDYPNFIGIGTSTNPYRGTFDGQYHRIKNLVIDDDSRSNVGLFAWITGGTTIKNLIMDSTNVIKGYMRVAGVVGNSNSLSAGVISFEQVANEGSVSSTDINAAGIIGANEGALKFNMINCYNSGTIAGKDQSAALTGWAGPNASIVNCYNSGTISGIWKNWTLFRYWGYAANVLENCYEIPQYIAPGVETDPSSVAEVTAEQVKSGELCYLLNGSVSGGEVFYQDLGKDSHPTFLATHGKVYKYDDGTYSNEKVNGINATKANILSGSKKIYTTDGVEVPTLQKGVNIVRENGTVKKVLVK